MLIIDGSEGEGGGQIIRTAISLAALTETPCTITNIRHGRPNPGLQPQHLAAVRAVAGLCNADISGHDIGSTELTFVPHALSHHHLDVDVGTAGATTLVAQALLIPMMHTDRECIADIRGGTDVRWAPTSAYLEHIFAWHLRRMGIDIEIETVKHGFYPVGGGHLRVTVRPPTIAPLTCTNRGEHHAIDAWSAASQHLEKSRVAERQLDGSSRELQLAAQRHSYVPAASPGSSILLRARFENAILGASALGERGQSAEQVGAEAARALSHQIGSGACLDEWMTDQILPYLALASGRSEISVARITEHARTNMRIIERFLPVRFSVTDNRIACTPEFTAPGTSSALS